MTFIVTDKYHGKENPRHSLVARGRAYFNRLYYFFYGSGEY